MRNLMVCAALGALSSLSLVANAGDAGGTVQRVFASSRWDAFYAMGDPGCETTPDGLIVKLWNTRPPSSGANPDNYFFLPRTHRDYDVIAAMMIAAKLSNAAVYIREELGVVVCGMPVIAMGGLNG